jgi:hypothetical protein
MYFNESMLLPGAAALFFCWLCAQENKKILATIIKVGSVHLKLPVILIQIKRSG